MLGFAEPEPAPDEQRAVVASGPLALEEERLPSGSPWPLLAGLASLLVGLGLVFGPWLWIPGAALALSTLWGWLTELSP